MRWWPERWRRRRPGRRRPASDDFLPLVELAGRDAHLPKPYLVVPPGPRRPAETWLRAGLGSLGFALALGVVAGQMLRGLPEAGTDIRASGAGRLGDDVIRGHLPAAGTSFDLALMRERFLSTGIPERVDITRSLSGSVRIEVVEKRAVAVLAGHPPLALAEGGSVLGPVTAADLDWAIPDDLPLVHLGAGGGAADLALAAGIAARLQKEPDLDRLVSELDFADGPDRVVATLREPPIYVVCSEPGCLDQLARARRAVPALLARWPEMAGLDARVEDRLFLARAPVGGDGPASEARKGANRR